MANAASLVLPGSNLTNLLVLGHRDVSGASFAWDALPASLAAIAVTGAGLVFWAARAGAGAPGKGVDATGARAGPGVLAAAVAAVLVLVLRDPALPVLVVALVAGGVAVARREVALRRIAEAVGPVSIAALFVVAVALGTLAREWGGPADALDAAGQWGTAGIAAAASVAVNNLPAAALLSAQTPEHPLALLIGLDLGPNLAVTGSLSALIWWRTARTLGARPSARTYSRVGVPLGLAAMAVSLLALTVFR